MEDEIVVLVDSENNVLGTSPKLETHNADTPLHRGFSVFLFNKKGELLLQQRAKHKKTWPGVWSNSCCGHPMLNESVIDAARRRLQYELRISDANLQVTLPDYRYKTEKDGIVENEICPVIVGISNQLPVVNPKEVKAIQFILWHEFLNRIEKNPGNYSFWAEEEAKLLAQNKKFNDFFSTFASRF